MNTQQPTSEDAAPDNAASTPQNDIEETVTTETDEPETQTAASTEPETDATKDEAPKDELEDLDDFGQVLEKWEAGLKTLKEGQLVQGKVLKILDKEVIVDVGYKSEGVIDIDEFRGSDGSFEVNEGDRVEVLLEKTENADGYVVLSKEKAEKMKIWEEVERAYETGEPVTGRVIDRIKGGLKVDIGVPAFLPGSLVDVRPVRNLESLRGQEFRMRVIKVNRRRGNIVLSRKALLEVENAEKKQKTLADLEEGKVLRGVVKNLTEYGAFIDLGGIDGLLHITDMAWGRISHPSEKFQIGDEVDVIVLKFDRERERVSLGFKQLQDDPWENADAKYPKGMRIRGKAVSLTDYGAFVEVEDGVEGLIHVSEMSWSKRVKHPSKILAVGDWVECVVLDIDQEGRRLSLGLKQTAPNPWELIDTKYRVGDHIKGRVRNITDFGAFIEVEEGIDGLVHISDLSWTKRIKHPSEALAKGDEVEAVILKIDSENQRLSLGIKQLQPNTVEDFFRTHTVGDVLAGKIVRLTEFGAFVELFEGVEGLVHVSEMSEERIEKPEDKFATGQDVRVKIIKMDPVEKKIGLSIKAAIGEPEGTVADYREEVPSDGGATFADLMSAQVLRREAEGTEASASEPESEPAEATEAASTEAPESEAEVAEPETETTPEPIVADTDTPAAEAAPSEAEEVTEEVPSEKTEEATEPPSEDEEKTD
jgi:small subunit ribosomal protein S1